jgi:hypothetical protein
MPEKGREIIPSLSVLPQTIKFQSRPMKKSEPMKKYLPQNPCHKARMTTAKKK